VIFLDECVFTFNTFASRTWYLNKQTLVVPEKAYSHKAQALILAVSLDEGIENALIFPRSISNKELILFLEGLS